MLDDDCEQLVKRRFRETIHTAKNDIVFASFKMKDKHRFIIYQ